LALWQWQANHGLEAEGSEGTIVCFLRSLHSRATGFAATSILPAYLLFLACMVLSCTWKNRIQYAMQPIGHSNLTQCDLVITTQPGRCTSRISYIITTSQPEPRHSKRRSITTEIRLRCFGTSPKLDCGCSKTTFYASRCLALHDRRGQSPRKAGHSRIGSNLTMSGDTQIQHQSSIS
jgi:hypothetical protein